jgi:ankyrin repeat protein
MSGLIPDCKTSICSNLLPIPFLETANGIGNNYLDDISLMDEIEKDNLEYIKTELSVSKNYNRQMKAGYAGNTILHNAILSNASNIIEYMLRNSVDLSVENKDGNTVLHYACLGGNSSLSYRLIELGADIHSKNKYGDTSLHSSIRSGDISTVIVLISAGASLFTTNVLGETALHVAVLSPQKELEIIKQLVRMGSELRTKNNNDESLMKTLNRQSKTKQNAEIRTYLQKQYVIKFNENYIDLITEDPDASFISMVNNETSKDDKLSNYNNLGSIDIELTDEYINKSNTYKTTNYKKEIEHFKCVGKDIENNTKFIYKLTGIFIILLLIVLILINYNKIQN